MSASSLVWPPLYRVLEDRIKGGDDLILVLVPFAKLVALQHLHCVHSNEVRLKVVCRWRPEDLLSGASDVEVFTYLKESGCELFTNPDIHLKVYVFASNAAFSTSGNLTCRGLGYSESANIEVGNMVSLSSQDWTRIYGIINASRQVDDALYVRYRAFVEEHPKLNWPEWPQDLMPPAKTYTISSLPATESLARLADFYFGRNPGMFTPEEVRRAAHDLAIFKVPPGLTESEFDERLGMSFHRSPFVTDFVELLKAERSLRFGAVNDWIYQKCEDVPLPYRWELKENTRIFYSWLSYFFPEISWNRPNYSQIIYWQQSSKDQAK